MKTAEWQQWSRSGDFIVKLKKIYLFYVWISEFRMVVYFLKTCFLNRQFKKSSGDYWTFMELGTELLQIFVQRNWKY